MVIISGSESSLGSKLIPYLRNSFQVYAFDNEQGNICDINFLRNLFKTVNPKYFINLKEKTDIIECEFEKEKCYETNSLCLKAISQVCCEYDVTLIQLSSIYVYGNSEREVTENSVLSPEFVYADSKLLAEKIISESTVRSVILRTGDRFFEKGSFLNRIITHIINDETITVPKDVFISAVSSSGICSAINHIMTNNLDGIYNCSCLNPISIYDFAKNFLNLHVKIKKPDYKTEIESVDISDYLFPVDIPKSLKISLQKLINSGFSPESDIFNSIEEYINNL